MPLKIKRSEFCPPFIHQATLAPTTHRAGRTAPAALTPRARGPVVPRLLPPSAPAGRPRWHCSHRARAGWPRPGTCRLVRGLVASSPHTCRLATRRSPARAGSARRVRGAGWLRLGSARPPVLAALAPSSSWPDAPRRPARADCARPARVLAIRA
jgi:hypothetical protein